MVDLSFWCGISGVLLRQSDVCMKLSNCFVKFHILYSPL